MKNILHLLAVAILAAGCHGMDVRAHGGHVAHIAASGVRAELQQPENPKEGASQNVEVNDDFELPLPAGTTVEIPMVTTSATGAAVTNNTKITMPTNAAPAILKKSHTEKSAAKIGGSQLDELGATIAKLRTTKWWSIIGFVIFVGGVFAALYPPATALLGGYLPGVGIAVSGLVIAVLPILLIGHETLILIGAALAAGMALFVWYAHHHGGVIAELKTLKAKL